MASATATYGQKESSDQNFDYMFKILIIGNSSVGKTSFLFRYADDSFTPAFVSTVGIDFKVKTIYRNDKRIKLQIWVRHLINWHLRLDVKSGWRWSWKNTEGSSLVLEVYLCKWIKGTGIFYHKIFLHMNSIEFHSCLEENKQWQKRRLSRRFRWSDWLLKILIISHIFSCLFTAQCNNILFL